MKTLFLALIGAAVVSVISLFFPEGRDWWEEVFEYIFSFEWFGDMIEFFGGLFDDMGELSIGGLIFGLAAFALVWVLRKRMLYPFLFHMGHFEFYFWMVVTYAGCAFMGYLIGKSVFDD